MCTINNNMEQQRGIGNTKGKERKTSKDTKKKKKKKKETDCKEERIGVIGIRACTSRPPTSLSLLIAHSLANQEFEIKPLRPIFQSNLYSRIPL